MPLLFAENHSKLSSLNCNSADTQLTETYGMHALFSVCSLREDNMITSKPTWKLNKKPSCR